VAQALHIAKETLFYDDSFRQFKHQSKRKKSILGLQYIFPIFDWGFHWGCQVEVHLMEER
jgi:hypothetical protein